MRIRTCQPKADLASIGGLGDFRMRPVHHSGINQVGTLLYSAGPRAWVILGSLIAEATAYRTLHMVMGEFDG